MEAAADTDVLSAGVVAVCRCRRGRVARAREEAPSPSSSSFPYAPPPSPCSHRHRRRRLGPSPHEEEEEFGSGEEDAPSLSLLEYPWHARGGCGCSCSEWSNHMSLGGWSPLLPALFCVPPTVWTSSGPAGSDELLATLPQSMQCLIDAVRPPQTGSLSDALLLSAVEARGDGLSPDSGDPGACSLGGGPLDAGYLQLDEVGDLEAEMARLGEEEEEFWLWIWPGA